MWLLFLRGQRQSFAALMNRFISVFALSLFTSAVHADVWVFDPSAGIDQRFDDNYTINPDNPASVSATRAVGSIGISRESQSTVFKGLVRVDGLLTLGDDGSQGAGGDLNSNRILFLDAKHNRARSSIGIGLNIKRDTPSRDISADITDISAIAADTGASVTQTENVARTRIIISPNWSYNLSRRASVESKLNFTSVRHTLPSVEDAIRKQFQLGNPGAPIPDDLSIDTVGVFTVNDELDDFDEIELDVGYRYKLSPISTFSMFFAYSQFTTETEPNAALDLPVEQREPDPNERQVLRNPKRVAVSNTAKFRLGWDHALTPTINVGFQVGVFQTNFDNSDLLRPSDPVNVTEQNRLAIFANQERSEQGYLGAVTVSRSVGIARYKGKIGFDVLPSDVGSQVESFEAVGDYERELGPLLDFSFRIRAYEPDAINASADDEFARRFLSLEPKLVWRVNRTWTVAASYRYRRQKNRVNPNTGESNALLFSLKYSPPSEIRDLNQGR